MPKNKNLSHKKTKELYDRLNSRAYYILSPDPDRPGKYDLIPKLKLIAEEVGCSIRTVQYHANENYREFTKKYARELKRKKGDEQNV